jgi:hypothetical protein
MCRHRALKLDRYPVLPRVSATHHPKLQLPYYFAIGTNCMTPSLLPLRVSGIG